MGKSRVEHECSICGAPVERCITIILCEQGIYIMDWCNRCEKIVEVDATLGSD